MTDSQNLWPQCSRKIVLQVIKQQRCGIQPLEKVLKGMRWFGHVIVRDGKQIGREAVHRKITRKAAVRDH